jgi:hypothetical protein
VSAEEEVPTGTIQTILSWVGDDPQRAQAALDKERAGLRRARLITKLEAIASGTPSQEPAVSEQNKPDQSPPQPPTGDPQRQPDEPVTGPQTPQTEPTVTDAEGNEMAPEDLAPEYPTHAAVEPGYGTTVSPINVRDADVEVPEDASIVPDDIPDWQLGAAERASAQGGPAIPEGEEPVFFEGDPVEYFQAASSGTGMVLSFNGNAVVLNPQQVGQLKQAVDRAVVGLAL